MHVSRRPRRRVTRTTVLAASSLTAALATTLAVVSGPTASANLPVERAHHHHHRPAVHTVKVDPHLFGVHDRYLSSLTHRSTESIRLWDAGTTWPEIHPTPTTWNWAPLDAAVRAAHANHTQVTLVLGLSPAYAADASTDAPNVSMYKSYLKSVMTRYSAKRWGYRGIAAYQVWNEVNIKTFWTGSNAQIVALTKAAYDVRNQVDRGALLVAPAMVTRLKFEQKGIQTYYASKVAGTHKPVWKYLDAISLNLYPAQSVALPRGHSRASTPEDSMALLKAVRVLLKKDRVPASLPVWNTEVNYGLGSGAPAVPISPARQVANVMRTYLLNAANGVRRVDWYAYDMGEMAGGGTLGNTLLTDPALRTAGTLTAAGKAYSRIESWMKGTMVGTRTQRPCVADRHGTYTCEMRYHHGVGRIYWNPFHTGRVHLVHSARKKVDELGRSSRAKGGSALKVDYRPVLVLSSK